MADTNRRRSERLLLTVPIRVEGTDSKGEKFQEATRTLVINRHGARIELKRPVAPGQPLRIVNLGSNREAEFRVVGRTAPLKEAAGEWGVECHDEKKNIWGIDFPPLDGESGGSALLECRRCENVSLTPLSVVELDVLTNAGLLTRDCKQCGQATPWGNAEKVVGMPAPGPGLDPSIKEVMEPPRPESSRRQHSRVSMKMPIRVRDWQGGEEITKSENVSKGGLAFMTEKNFEIGEALQVTCPYDPRGTSIEIRARVVRRREMKGTGNKVYGVRYEREGS